MVGHTNPAEAQAGTVRGDFSLHVSRWCRVSIFSTYITCFWVIYERFMMKLSLITWRAVTGTWFMPVTHQRGRCGSSSCGSTDRSSWTGTVSTGSSLVKMLRNKGKGESRTIFCCSEGLWQTDRPLPLTLCNNNNNDHDDDDNNNNTSEKYVKLSQK